MLATSRPQCYRPLPPYARGATSGFDTNRSLNWKPRYARRSYTGLNMPHKPPGVSNKRCAPENLDNHEHGVARARATSIRMWLCRCADFVRVYPPTDYANAYFDSRASRSRHRARTCSPRRASHRAAASPFGIFDAAALGVPARGSKGCGAGLGPSGILICGVTLPSGCPVVASIDRSASVGRVLLAGCRAGATSMVGGAEATGDAGVICDHAVAPLALKLTNTANRATRANCKSMVPSSRRKGQRI